MHDQHPAPEGSPARPEGNRPAHNARLTTPGLEGDGSFQSSEEASDFLGLGEEFGDPPPASAGNLLEPFPDEPQAQAEEQDLEVLGEEDLEVLGEEDLEVLGEEEGFDQVLGLGDEADIDGADASDTEAYASDEETYVSDTEEYGQGDVLEPLEEEVDLEGEAYLDEEVDPEQAVEDEEGVLTSWTEEEPTSRGRGKLVALSAGVVVIGMLGVAMLKLVDASKNSGVVRPEPLAAHQNPTPDADRVQSPGAPAQGAPELERVAFDSEGNATPTPTRTDIQPAPSDPVADARNAFETARGDTPPVGFDPLLDNGPPSTAWTEEATYEGSPLALEQGGTPGQAQPGPLGDTGSGVAFSTTPDPGGFPVSTESTGEIAEASSPDPVAAGASEPAPAEVELVGVDPAIEEGSTGQATPVEVAVTEPGTAETVPDEVAVAEPSPVEVVAADTGPAEAAPDEVVVTEPPVELIAESTPAGDPPTPDASAPTQGTWLEQLASRISPPSASRPLQGPPPSGPTTNATVPGAAQGELVTANATPTGSEGPTPPVTSGADAVEQLISGRDARPSAVGTEQVAPPPAQPPSNLRQASSSDLATVWQSPDLPATESLERPAKLLTPNVGRVRIVLKSNDVFEGRMYAVGEGSVWIDTEYGRMALDGARIASMAQLVSPDGTPVLGEKGSEDLSGMDRVRVKTPGGTFYGKIIAKDDKTTTIVTDDGARLTLDSKLVELLVDAPKVTIKGTVPEKELKKKP